MAPRPAALGLLFVLALAACGRLTQSDSTGARAGSDDCGESSVPAGAAPDTSTSYSVCPGDDPAPVPKSERVTPVPGMLGVRAVPWQRIDVGGDDRTLIVHFTSGVQPCFVLDHVQIDYGDDAVTITLYEGHQPGSEDLACPEIGIFKSVTVVLDEPLAGRTLVDGAAQDSRPFSAGAGAILPI
ncbi:MAG: hypothetical protein ACT4PO_08140 [Actinomycetota bacterium]